jgi:hypothetical protein
MPPVDAVPAATTTLSSFTRLSDAAEAFSMRR